MAGGPNAAVVKCMACTGKANRVSEGLETDLYECEVCYLRFLIDWSRDGPPEKPHAPLTTPNDDMRSPVWHALLAAFCFTVVGTLCAYLIIHDAPGEGWATLPLYTGAATFLISFALWYSHLTWFGQHRPSRAAIVGAAIGFLVHPVTWCFFITANWLADFLFTESPPLRGKEIISLADVLLIVGVFSFWSLFLLGWITILMGALVGALVGRWQRHQLDDQRYLGEQRTPEQSSQNTADVTGWNERGDRAYDFDCPLAVPALRDRLNQTGPWVWQIKKFSLAGPHLFAVPGQGSIVRVHYATISPTYSAILNVKSEGSRETIDANFRSLLTKVGVNEIRSVKPEDAAYLRRMRHMTGG